MLRSWGEAVMSEGLLRSYGVLLLRIALGTIFIAHSVIYMTMTLTLAGTVDFFASLGLPPWFAYATILAEALGGLLLILGIQTRWVAAVDEWPHSLDRQPGGEK
jgi:uncharacterized membrane protein YphA (DoxX/SURF4 family)